MSKAQAEGPDTRPDQTRGVFQETKGKRKGVSRLCSLQFTNFFPFPLDVESKREETFFLISIISFRKGRKPLKTPDPALSESCH
jgi:hypothetical protein